MSQNESALLTFGRGAGILLCLLGITLSPRTARAEPWQKLITYQIGEPGRVSAAVYGEDGRVIRTLLRGKQQPAGRHTLQWDGLDRYGHPVEAGEYEWRVLRTPGFTAKFVMTLGTNPPLQAYEVGGRWRGRGWVGNHGGPTSLALDESGFYVGSPISEFSPVLLNQTLDGKRQHWQSLQYQVNMGPVAMDVGAEERLYFLQENAVVMVVNAQNSRKIAQWDLLPEGVERAPKPNYGSGEKVYRRSRVNAGLSARGDTLVLTCPLTETLRWVDTGDGSVDASVELESPGGVEIGPDGTIYAITDGAVRIVTRDGAGKSVVAAADLSNPVRLSYDTASDHLLVAEGAPSHQVKRFSLKGKRVATYGREGGRRTGAYDPADFHGVTDIVADGKGGFLVVEPHVAPRRTAHFKQSGELIQEWYGGTPFFTRPAVDPRDPSLVWFSTGGGWFVLAEVDYKGGSYRVLETHHPARMADGLLAAGVGSTWRTFWQVRYHGGTRYLVSRHSPPAVLVHRPQTHKLEPVVVGGRGKQQLERAAELAGQPGAKARSFLWTDGNGDRKVQAGEIQLFDSSLRGGPLWKGVDVGQGFDVLTAGTAESERTRQRKLLLRRFPHTGWTGAVPTYEGRLETVGEALMHGELIQTMGFYESGQGGYYALAGFTADRHGYGWPTNYTGGNRLVRWNPDGSHAWTVGRAAVSNPHNRTSPPGHLHHPVGFLGEVRGNIVVGDRVVHPAMTWTPDGLYAGYLLENRADDGLPECLYQWWRTAEGNDCIINYDCEAVGAVATLEDGSVYWLATGWQTIIVYRVTGWDGWSRSSGTIEVDSAPPHAKGAGNGLRGEYYVQTAARGEDDMLAELGGVFQGKPVMTRVDGQLWFAGKNWYGYPEKTGGEVWGARGPFEDQMPGGDLPEDWAGEFSVRWAGELEAPLTEPFVFSVYAKKQAEVRVWLDGEKIIDATKTPAESEALELQAGRRYPLRVEFLNRGANPTFSLNWESPSTDRQRIPRAYLYTKAK